MSEAVGVPVTFVQNLIDDPAARGRAMQFACPLILPPSAEDPSALPSIASKPRAAIQRPSVMGKRANAGGHAGGYAGGSAPHACAAGKAGLEQEGSPR